MNKHTLLVVDDEPDVAVDDSVVHDLLRRRLQRAGGPATWRRGIAILRRARCPRHHELDQRDAEDDRRRTARERPRVRHPHAIRLLFTGYADIEAIIAAINHGHIYRFLRKPWEPQELEEAVSDAVREYERLVREADSMLHLTDEVRTQWKVRPRRRSERREVRTDAIGVNLADPSYE